MKMSPALTLTATKQIQALFKELCRGFCSITPLPPLFHEFQHSPFPDDHFFVSSFSNDHSAELERKRERTREMEEQLRADRLAMEAKEKERLMLTSERDQKLAVKNAVDKLVAEFLEADDNKDFDAQKAIEKEIVALMSPDTAATVVGKNGDSE